MVEDGVLKGMVEERYAGWKSAEAKAMLAGKRTLDEIAERVEKQKIAAAAALRTAGTAGEYRQPVCVNELVVVRGSCFVIDRPTTTNNERPSTRAMRTRIIDEGA